MSRMGSRVRVSSRHPEAAAVCDKCGLWRNHADLARQMRYAGPGIVWSGLLVCADACLDPLNPLDRPLVLKPDGLPIADPRPEPYGLDYAAELGTETRQPIGAETGPILIIDDETT